MKWVVLRKATDQEHQNTTKRCSLSGVEKMEITGTEKKLSLNTRSELVSKCCHQSQFYLNKSSHVHLQCLKAINQPGPTPTVIIHSVTWTTWQYYLAVKPIHEKMYHVPVNTYVLNADVSAFQHIHLFHPVQFPTNGTNTEQSAIPVDTTPFLSISIYPGSWLCICQKIGLARETFSCKIHKCTSFPFVYCNPLLFRCRFNFGNFGTSIFFT